MRAFALRGEEPPDDATVVVRGGAAGLSDDTLRRTASASHAEYGFYGVSVFLALDQSVAVMCASIDALRRYSMIQESTAGALRAAGFVLLATDARPHFDVVLPTLDDAVLSTVRGCFTPPRPNPGRS